MDLLATLRRSGGINALARQLGVPSAIATAGVQALLPALLAEFGQYRGDMPRLLDILSELGGGAMAAEVMGVEQVDAAHGAALLGRLSGEGDGIRRLVQVAGSSEVEPEILERMLPLLAMLIGGYIAARSAGGGVQARELETIFDATETGDPADDESAPL